MDLIAAIDGSGREQAGCKLAEFAPDLLPSNLSDGDRLQKLSAHQQLLENVWQAGTVLTRGVNSSTFQRILNNRGLSFHHIELACQKLGSAVPHRRVTRCGGGVDKCWRHWLEQDRKKTLFLPGRRLCNGEAIHTARSAIWIDFLQQRTTTST